MKKIIILCSVLLAITTFAVSCKNSTNFVNVTDETTRNAYVVTGTIKSTTISGADTNNTVTTTYLTTFTNANAIVTSYDKKTTETNFDDYYEIELFGSYTEDETNVTKTAGVDGTPDVSTGFTSDDRWLYTFYENDDAFYFYDETYYRYIKIEDLSIGGKEFTLKFTTYFSDDRKPASDPSVFTDTVEYDLTFKKGLD